MCSIDRIKTCEQSLSSCSSKAGLFCNAATCEQEPLPLTLDSSVLETLCWLGKFSQVP